MQTVHTLECHLKIVQPGKKKNRGKKLAIELLLYFHMIN